MLVNPSNLTIRRIKVCQSPIPSLKVSKALPSNFVLFNDQEDVFGFLRTKPTVAREKREKNLRAAVLILKPTEWGVYF